ncbi:MAG: hypothetical protein ACJ790_08000 [Myxococcaceae bacterium]
MKTLAVLAVFFCSLLALGATLDHQAGDHVAISNGITAPEEMPGSELASGQKDKHHPDGGDDSKSEEELFPADQHQALQALDPGVFDDLVRIRIASRDLR